MRRALLALALGLGLALVVAGCHRYPQMPRVAFPMEGGATSEAFELLVTRARATGYAIATGPGSLRVRLPKQNEQASAPALPAGAHADELAYLVALVKSEIKPSGLSSLENNLIVTEILEAARESARTGRTVTLKSR